MPLLDSFKVDHTKMRAPLVRIAKTMHTPKGDTICVFDLRFTQPNQEMLPEKGMHTLEHLFAGFMRDHLNRTGIEIIDISPMGCRTGFYMSVIGAPTEQEVIQAWQHAMKDILALRSETDIPELNQFQCGSYRMHSLTEAKQICQTILTKTLEVCYNDAILLSEAQLNALMH